MRYVRRASAVVSLAMAAVITVGVAAAWACVPGAGSGGSAKPKLTVTPEQLKPGEQVTVTAPASSATVPIDLRLNSVDGPLLGRLDRENAAGDVLRATFTVPPDTNPGQNVLIAVQQGTRWEPALLAVAGADGVVPADRQYTSAAEPGGSGGRGTGVIVLTLVMLGAVAGALLFGLRMRGRSAHGSAVPAS